MSFIICLALQIKWGPVPFNCDKGNFVAKPVSGSGRCFCLFLVFYSLQDVPDIFDCDFQQKCLKC